MRFDLTGGFVQMKEPEGTVRVYLQFVLHRAAVPLNENSSNTGRAYMEYAGIGCGFRQHDLDQAGKLLHKSIALACGAAAP